MVQCGGVVLSDGWCIVAGRGIILCLVVVRCQMGCVVTGCDVVCVLVRCGVMCVVWCSWL